MSTQTRIYLVTDTESGKKRLLDNLFAAIKSEAKDLYIARHQGCSQADYLKHIYTPETPNA